MIEENIESESSSSRIHPRVIKMSRAASSLVEKVRPILALYRQILRTHVAVLPEPMKTLGDKYVQAEFRQHLQSAKTTKEHWRAAQPRLLQSTSERRSAWPRVRTSERPSVALSDRASWSAKIISERFGFLKFISHSCKQFVTAVEHILQLQKALQL